MLKEEEAITEMETITLEDIGRDKIKRIMFILSCCPAEVTNVCNSFSR